MAKKTNTETHLDKLTSISVRRRNRDYLASLCYGREKIDGALTRLINGQVDVNVEVIMIDNELPQLHTLVFQLGDDKDSLYYWDGKTIEKVSVKEANRLLKQPKPNFLWSKPT